MREIWYHDLLPYNSVIQVGLIAARPTARLDGGVKAGKDANADEKKKK